MTGQAGQDGGPGLSVLMLPTLHTLTKRSASRYTYLYTFRFSPGMSIVTTTLRPSAAERAGISRSGLYRAAERGEIERIARGIYVPAGTAVADWDAIEAVTRRPEATICLTSALARYDLTDTIPRALDVAIPRGTRIPKSTGAIAWHQFDNATFTLGRNEILIHGTDLMIGISTPERAIVDAFRLRGDVGYELARDALKEWLRRGGKPIRLMELATRLPRAKAPMLQALELLS